MFAAPHHTPKGPHLHQKTLHRLDSGKKTRLANPPDFCGHRKSHGTHSGYLTLTLFFIVLSVWLGLQVVSERHKTHRNVFESRSSPLSSTPG